MIKTIYLAGKMSGRLWSDVVAEREHARKLFEAAGIEVLDPIRGKDIPTDRILDGGTEGAVPNGRCVVQRDLRDVARADATVVLTVDMGGFGTTVEWARARFLGKPVFGVTARGVEELGMWRVEMATAFFHTIEDVVNHIKTFWT